MRVLPHIERPVDSLLSPVVADRLGNRQDMRFGECAAQRRAAVPAGAEANQLVRVIQYRDGIRNKPSPGEPNRSSISFGAGLPASGEITSRYRLLALGFKALGMVSPSKFRLRIRQSCGRSKTCRSSQHSGSLCAPTRSESA